MMQGTRRPSPVIVALDKFCDGTVVDRRHLFHEPLAIFAYPTARRIWLRRLSHGSSVQSRPDKEDDHRATSALLVSVRSRTPSGR